MTHTILRIDSSSRHDGSVTRDLNDRIIARFDRANIITRDLTAPPAPSRSDLGRGKQHPQG